MRTESIKLNIHFKDIEQAQICRTCTHASDPLWRYTAKEVQKEIDDNGTTRQELMCHPSDDINLSKVIRTIPIQDIFGSKSERALVVTNLAESYSNDIQKTQSIAIVESCGQSTATKCTTCNNFVAVTVPVPIRFRPTSQERFRDAIIGGYCGLPAEGVLINDKIVTCHYVHETKISEPNCMSCQFLETSSIADDYHRTPAKVDLDAVEQFETKRQVAIQTREANAVGERPQPWLIWNKMREQALTHLEGVWFFFDALIVSKTPDSYCVSFTQNAHTAFINVNNDFYRLLPIGDKRIAVGIYGLEFVKHGLLINDKSTIMVPPSINSPSTIKIVDESKLDRINNHCIRCNKIPCTFHVRLPQTNYDTGEITFSDPTAEAFIVKSHPKWDFNIKLIPHENNSNLIRYIAFLDGNGDALLPRVAITYRSKMLEQLNQIQQNSPELFNLLNAFNASYNQLMRTVRKRTVTREVGWLNTNIVGELFKKHCSQNLPHTRTEWDPEAVRLIRKNDSWLMAGQGVTRRHIGSPGTTTNIITINDKRVFVDEHMRGIDLRVAFGDTFGQPREFNDKSWAYRMENEALSYAGITPRNPNEREFSSQRLHEEILASEAIFTHRQEHIRKSRELGLLPTPTLHKGELHTVYLDTSPVGIVCDQLDAYESIQEFHEEQRGIYMDWLDEQFETDLIDDYIDESNGHSLRMQTISKVHWSNRLAVHGYTIQRLAKKPRGTAKTESPLGPDDIFRMRQTNETKAIERSIDNNDTKVEGYVCSQCSAGPYDPTQINSQLECPDCGSHMLYRNMMLRGRLAQPIEPVPPRIADGMSRIILKDKSNHLEQSRLLSMVCPLWVRKGSNPLYPITLDKTERSNPNPLLAHYDCHPLPTGRWSIEIADGKIRKNADG